MKHVDPPPASASRATRPSLVVVGLAEDDARRPVDVYFAAFRWEPSPIDPVALTASVFLAMLHDVLVDQPSAAPNSPLSETNDSGHNTTGARS